MIIGLGYRRLNVKEIYMSGRQTFVSAAPTGARCISACAKTAKLASNVGCRTTSTIDNARARCVKVVKDDHTSCVKKCGK